MTPHFGGSVSRVCMGLRHADACVRIVRSRFGLETCMGPQCYRGRYIARDAARRSTAAPLCFFGPASGGEAAKGEGRYELRRREGELLRE